MAVFSIAASQHGRPITPDSTTHITQAGRSSPSKNESYTMQQSQSGNKTAGPAFPEWKILTAGLCASLVGIGLARFAYTPLLPAIINAHWFPAATAAYLGAANLGGYLAGALLGTVIARRIGTIVSLRLMMLLACAAFFACAVPVTFIWFFLWRFVSGVSGGALMVVAATSILPFVRPSRRGLASGVIFMGVGLGVAASGTLVPLLLNIGLSQTWGGLGFISLLLTLLVWSWWPQPEAEADHASGRQRTGAVSQSQSAGTPGVSASQPTQAAGAPVNADLPPPRWQASRSLAVLYMIYGLNAVGLVAHMVFLVDFVARGLGWGVNTGSLFWIVYGVGAIAGPLVCGAVADRIGYGPTLRGALLLQLLVVLIPVLTATPLLLVISSFVMGAFTPGIVPLVLGRLREMLPHSPASQRSAWSRATASFALMQAAAAYAMSFVFARSGGQYSLLFILAAGALAIALVMSMFSLRHYGTDSNY